MEFEVIDELTPELCQSIEKLEKSVFPNTYRPGRFTEEAPSKPGLLGLILKNESGEMMAYKIGYQLKTNTFYSWVGGVHPEYRGKGIANKLMVEQHKLLRELKYKYVRTKTRMSFRLMLITNLKHGFDITGLSYKSSISGLVIQMEKSL